MIIDKDFAKNFEFPTLTKIHGKPDYCSIKKIWDEIKANASSVYSDLGGGQHGHLGLVSTTPGYALVSAIPYVRYVHPGPLVIPVNTSIGCAKQLCEEHQEHKTLFKEMIDLEKVLITLLIQAIPSVYLHQFRNVHSNAIDQQIPAIFTRLMDDYGNITEDEFKDALQALRQKVFDISEPLVAMFNKIEDMVEFSKAAQVTMTDSQIVNLGIKLI